MIDIIECYCETGFSTMEDSEIGDIAEFIKKETVSNEDLKDVDCTFYRGLRLSIEEYEEMKENGFEMLHSFESFSEDEEQAVRFADALGCDVKVVVELEWTYGCGIPVYTYTGRTLESEWLVLDREFETYEVVEENDLVRIKIR